MAIRDFDVEPIVLRELEPGEQLLWSGRPGQGLRLRRAEAWVIPFSIVWAGFWVFWESDAIQSGAPLWIRLWGLPFLVVAVYVVAGRFVVDVWVRRNTVYGVTARRVIVCSGLFSRRTTSHALEALPAITLSERRHGEGDVVLDATNMNHVAAGGLVPKGSSVPPALEFLPQARHVYEIIREAHRRAAE